MVHTLFRVTVVTAILVIGIVTILLPTTTADWVAECNDAGFNPEQLACQTCQILPTEFITECQKCCQTWLDTKRITKPYAAAVVLDRGSGGDVASFFKENWDEVQQAKGTHQLQKMQTAKEQFNFFQARPSQVLFFDDSSIIKKNKVTLDIPGLVKRAVEIVNLDGMKREDMKDMLLTLLP
jgi:hypothetical protein